MITTKQEKDKTTIIVPRRLRKTELRQVVDYLSLMDERPKKRVSKKEIQKIADEVTKAAWVKLKKKRGFSWL
jgi:hypothetical protein